MERIGPNPSKVSKRKLPNGFKKKMLKIKEVKKESFWKLRILRSP